MSVENITVEITTPAPIVVELTSAQQGPAGPPGAASTIPGPPGEDGAVGIDWRGDWVNTTTYALGDGVAFGGSSYVSNINGNTGLNPATHSTEWSLLAQKGADGDKTFVFDQASAAAVWVIVHNLGKIPVATVIDSSGAEVEGDIAYDVSDPMNKMTITFSAAFAGHAYLN